MPPRISSSSSSSSAVTVRFLHSSGARCLANRGSNIVMRSGLTSRTNAVSKRFFSSRGKGDNRLQNEIMFFVLRMVVRVMGQATSYLWRTGYYKHAIGVAIATPVVCLVGLGAAYGERVPYSNRFHIVTMSRDAEANLAESARESIYKQEKDNFLPENDELFIKTKEICDNILKICHEDGLVAPTMNFKVHVVKSKIANAFVLPDGSIFVYTGLIPIALNEGALAAVIGHEISHALARHSAEKIGTLRLCLLLYEFILGLFDHYSNFAHSVVSFVAGTIVQVGLPLYHSRKMEMEADRIGLIIAAKAGYDPRLAADLWRRMSDQHGKKKEAPSKDKRPESKVIIREPEPTDDDYKNNMMLKGSNALVAAAPQASNTTAPATPTTTTADKGPAVATASPSTLTTASALSASPARGSADPHAGHNHSHATSSLSTRSRIGELLSTHPCHERRIEELSEYSLTLVSTYNDALERMSGEGRALPDSNKVLLPELTPKVINDMSDDTNFDYDYDENSLVSVDLAQKASALMVGPEQDEIVKFLKAIKRDGKAWGDR